MKIIRLAIFRWFHRLIWVCDKIQVGNVVMSGDVFAKILGLNSPFFAIKDGKITTKGKGSGFGVSFILQILWHVRQYI